MNAWPPYRGAGVWVEHIAEDFKRVKVRLTLRWYNGNYHGTHFGGSLYAMIDPFFALMVGQNLGRDYVVWDKRAAIQYLLPVTGVVTASFSITQHDVNRIRESVDREGRHEETFAIEILDRSGQVVAIAEKTIHIRRLSA